MDRRAILGILLATAVILVGWMLRSKRDAEQAKDVAPKQEISSDAASRKAAAAERPPAPQPALGRVRAPAATSPYTRFVFVREAAPDAVDRSRVAVLCTIADAEFTIQEFPIKNYALLDPVYASESAVYFVDEGIVRLDLATGVESQSREKIALIAASDAGRDGRFYGHVYGSASPETYVYDVARERRRRVSASDDTDSDNAVMSHDGRYVAHFEQASAGGVANPFGWNLVVLDVVDGTKKRIGRTYTYSPSPLSSSIMRGPPFVWIDAKTLCIMGRPVSTDESKPVKMADGQVAVFRAFDPSEANSLFRLDIETGRDEVLASVPGTRMDMARLNWNARAGRVEVTNGTLRYGLDIAGKRMVELEHDPAPFEQPAQDIKPAAAPSGRKGFVSANPSRYDRDVMWSPDQRRAVWKEPTGPGGGYDWLLYRGDDDPEPKTVLKDCAIVGWPIWCIPDALASVGPDAGLPGWEPIEFGPPSPEPPDRRTPYASVITIAVSTDKSSYLLNEPVSVTATITNVGTESVVMRRPRLFGTGPLHCTLKQLTGNGAPDSPLEFDYDANDEEIEMGPGQSLTLSRDLEIDKPGDYELAGTLDAPNSGHYRGRTTAEPVAFSVRDSGDERLLYEKIARLIESAKADFAMAGQGKDIDPYYNNAVADALRRLGNVAAPALIQAYDESIEPAFRAFLRQTIARLGSTDALPFFMGLMQIGNEAEQSEAVRAIMQTAFGNQNAEAADYVLQNLDAIMAHPNSEIRQNAVGAAISQSGAVADAVLSRALHDPDDEVCGSAALGIALRAETDVADWIDTIAGSPAREDTCAGQIVVRRVEEVAHLSENEPDGAQPALTLAEKLRRCAAWVRDNPETARRIFPAR